MTQNGPQVDPKWTPKQSQILKTWGPERILGKTCRKVPKNVRMGSSKTRQTGGCDRYLISLQAAQRPNLGNGLDKKCTGRCISLDHWRRATSMATGTISGPGGNPRSSPIFGAARRSARISGGSRLPLGGKPVFRSFQFHFV